MGKDDALRISGCTGCIADVCRVVGAYTRAPGFKLIQVRREQLSSSGVHFPGRHLSRQERPHLVKQENTLKCWQTFPDLAELGSLGSRNNCHPATCVGKTKGEVVSFL